MSHKLKLSLDDIIKQDEENKKRTHSTGESESSQSSSSRSYVDLRDLIIDKRRRQKSRQNSACTKTVKSVIVRCNTSGNPKLLNSKTDAVPSTSRCFEGGKLVISNLHYKLTDANLLDVFEVFGTISDSGIQYDSSGRSLGFAYVVYAQKADAINALKSYNGAELKGRRMRMKLMNNEIATNYHKAFRSSNFSKTGRKAGNRGDHKSTAARVRKQLTTEELDAELDEYAMDCV